jgi:DNA-binding NtrC family response regulator
MSSSILIVEDDQALRDLLRDELDAEGYDVHAVDGLTEARQALAEQRLDLVITDLKLPDGSGQDLLAAVADHHARPACLMITAFGSVQDAVAALKRGADDFLTKPLDMDHLLLTVARLLKQRQTSRELEQMRELVQTPSFHGIVGSSAPMRRLVDNLRLVAAADGPVLITGESGTGKELVARALHAESPRAGGPFVAINCAGIPRELIESELFGYEAGAFTGARSRRQGIFHEADGGSLLLDEIGEMPAELQAKLLRVLQDGAVRRVGGAAENPVDVRVIAATHRDVRALVEGGDFREDLYYRLETFTLAVPPLRERDDDLERLARHFLAQHAARLERHVEGIDRTALAALRAYGFPGNVRELSNSIQPRTGNHRIGSAGAHHESGKSRKRRSGRADSRRYRRRSAVHRRAAAALCPPRAGTDGGKQAAGRRHPRHYPRHALPLAGAGARLVRPPVCEA